MTRQSPTNLCPSRPAGAPHEPVASRVAAGKVIRRNVERRTRLDLQINLPSEQENTRMLVLLQAMARKMGALAEAVRPETISQEIEAAYAGS